MDKKDISLKAMTAWICGTILLVALIALWLFSAQPDPNDPYAECYDIFGNKDSKCAADIAVDRIYGRY